jgi:hypothetical protein
MHTPKLQGNKTMFNRRKKQSLPIASIQIPASGAALLWRLLGALLVITALALSLLHWELVWETLSEVLLLTLEAGEEALDTLFEAAGLNPAVSQMATAYTGFVLALVAVYFIVRKTIRLTHALRENIALYREAYGTIYKKWRVKKQAELLSWWESLDWMQKAAAATAFLLIGIPLALLASFILGELVTMFFI